jgi:hypothetical protein
MQTHRPDLVSLIGGLAFIGVALLGLLDTITLTVADLRWIGPGLLVLLGLALVLGGSRDRSVAAVAGGPDTTIPDVAPEPGATVAPHHDADTGVDGVGR